MALSNKEVTALFVKAPPLHRLKGKMADVFYAAVQQIREQYSGDASRIWKERPSNATIVRQFLEFKGAGPKIATMAANILVRDFKIPVSDKHSIDVSVDVQVHRTFERLGLVREGAANEELIYAARELNPAYPGVVDLSVWEVGRSWCRPRTPECNKCYLQEHCPTNQGNRA
jgi:endonuclease III